MTKSGKLLTITLNTAIDIIYNFKNFNFRRTNRITEDRVSKTAGGKGLNVARVANNLGVDVMATGIAGGHFGEFIAEKLDADNIPHNFYQSHHESRITVSILEDGEQTDILESGSALSAEEKELFMSHLETIIPDYDVVVVSGSNANGFPSDIYVDILDLAKRYKAKVILDSSGNDMRTTLQNPFVHPDAIKPNAAEIADILRFGNTAPTRNELIGMLQDPLIEKIPVVIVSCGKDGAIARINGKLLSAKVPKIKAINAVGSGDASVAGIAYSILHGSDPEDMLKNAMTAGILNTLEQKSGWIDMQKWDEYHSKIVVSLL